MMITFGEYCELGFSTVPESEFRRFEAMAETAIRRFTCGRVTNGHNIGHFGRYAVCELIDVYYTDFRRGGSQLAGFTNEGYSERYAEYDKLARTVEERAEDIVKMYFERDEVWRGVL